MAKPPVKKQVTYNQSVDGFFGEFGSGANSQIFFLQSAIKGPDLDQISLVSDLPGAEQWSVRDLFQRDVDQTRVDESIIPYFQDTGKVKFFNPLTLTLLPVDETTREVKSEMPDAEVTVQEIEGDMWSCIEAPGLFRARHLEGNPQYGTFEWNDKKIKVVAIDGQHRLSALKRMSRNAGPTIPQEEFNSWSIPVVLFSLRALDQNHKKSSVLEIIRNIFVYINTAAKPPNETRQILLTDESVNAVCTQEVLDYSHMNDVKPRAERDLKKLPLLFFDWRGAEDSGREIVNPGSLKSNVEIRDWLQNYILNKDFSAEQKAILNITPNHPLHDAFSRRTGSRTLTVEESRHLRKQFNETILPGLTYFLENYEPLSKYVERLRTIEHRYCEEGDISEYAFHKLRFGTHTGSDDIQDKVNKAYKKIIGDILDEINDLPSYIRLDIGLRGVVFAFGHLKSVWVKVAKPEDPHDWLGYSKWFTENLNKAFSIGWLAKKPVKQVADLMHQITMDHGGGIINYRIQDASGALGALMAVVVSAIGFNGKYSDGYKHIKEDLLDSIETTLRSGYRRESRVLLREEFPQGGKPLNEAVNKAAQEKVNAHLKKLESYLDKLNAA